MRGPTSLHPRPRSPMTDLTYYSIIGMARTWFKAMDFRFRVTG